MEKFTKWTNFLIHFREADIFRCSNLYIGAWYPHAGTQNAPIIQEKCYTKAIGFAYVNSIMVSLPPLLKTELSGLKHVIQIDAVFWVDTSVRLYGPGKNRTYFDIC